MSEQDKIQLFENQKIRTAWDTEKEEWYFSVKCSPSQGHFHLTHSGSIPAGYSPVVM